MFHPISCSNIFGSVSGIGPDWLSWPGSKGTGGGCAWSRNTMNNVMLDWLLLSVGPMNFAQERKLRGFH